VKKKLMVVLLCAATSVGLIAFAEITPGQKPPATNEVSEMRDQIKRLQAKVELLEYRTKSLESTVEQLRRSHTPAPAPMSLQLPAPPSAVPPLHSSQPPKIWGQGEVNGWAYYIVPCGEQSR